MVNYYLKMEPHLFKEAVQTQFERIRDEREAARAAAKEKEAQAKAAAQPDKSELVLYRWQSLQPILHAALQEVTHLNVTPAAAGCEPVTVCARWMLTASLHAGEHACTAST